MRFLHRVRIDGTAEAADRLRTLVHHAGYLLVPDSSAGVTITITDGERLSLDSVDSPLERAILRNLQELDEKKRFPGCSQVTVIRAGGNQEPDAVALTVPAGLHEAVALAILRSIVQTSEQLPASETEHDTVKRPWWMFWAALFLCVSSLAHAQQPFGVMDADSGAGVDPRIFVGLFTPSGGGPSAITLPATLGPNGGIRVDLVGGSISVSGSDGAILDGANSAIKATVFDYSNSNPMGVVLRDTNGDYVSVGGGTQYTEDAAAAADPVGTVPMLVRKDTPSTTVTTDGDNIAQRGTNYGAAYVTLLDTGGSAVSVGGGTQYTEDAAAAADPVGGAVNLIRSDTPTTAVANANGDNVAQRGSNYGAAYVTFLNSLGAFVGSDAAPLVVMPPTGSSFAVNDSGGALTVDGTVTVTDGAGALNVIIDSGTTTVTQATAANLNVTVTDGAGALNTIVDSGTITAVTAITNALPAGTNAIGKLAANSGVDIGDVDVTSIAAGNNNIGDVDVASIAAGNNNIGDVDIASFPDNEPINVAQMNGVTVLMGNGATGTGSPRVTVANDSTGIAGWGHIAHGSAVPTGVTMIGGSDGTNATRLYADPCVRGAKTYLPVDIVTATDTEITPSLAGASTHYYICSINLVTAAANNVAVVDDNTDGCGSPTAGIFGGVTSGEGYNFAAGGGIALGNGESAVGRTTTTNAVICIRTSAATQLSGMLVVVTAP